MVFTIDSYDGFKLAVDELCAFLSSKKISTEKAFDCKLVVHELIGNALQHSSGRSTLTAEIEEGFLILLVRDEKGFRPPEQGSCPSLLAERGRGLYLVDTLCVERTFTEKGEILVRISLT